jgi:hypothetical protein
VPAPTRPAPYYLPLQFEPLSAYLSRGLPAARWAEEQFALSLSAPSRGTPELADRQLEVVTALDRLPLQVKDLMRGLIDRLSLDPGSGFLPGTVATWHHGTLRVNVDWPDLEPVTRLSQRPTLRRRFLLSTLVHECGHALVEDFRGGVRLRDYVRLVAAGGWLPHPQDDPWPYLAGHGSLDQLQTHFLERLLSLDPRWDPELPVADRRQPGPAALDRQLPLHGPLGGSDVGFGPSLRLQPASKIALSIMAEERGALGLASRTGIPEVELRAALARHPSVSPYAEDEPCETLAEIFRCVQLEQPTRQLPALEEGWRLLVLPWREAELCLGPREPALPPLRPRLVHPVRGRL